MQRTKLSAVMLLSLGLLTGCGLIPSPAPIAVNADALCKDWRHKRINSRDILTEETAAAIEADNKSRPNHGCEYGENSAKPNAKFGRS